MNIFVVSHPDAAVSHQALVVQLARIVCVSRTTTPVVVVDERYNLADMTARQACAGYTRFELDEFRSRRRLDETRLNRVALLMNKVDTEWVLIDLGHHDQTICADLIGKLARFNYLSCALRGRNLVFLMPALSLSLNARLINASFNNLPGCSCATTRLRQLRRLLLTTHLKRIPLLAAVLRRLNARYSGLLRRLTRGG